MKVVKPGTKMAQQLQYELSGSYYKGRTLYEAYDRPSSAKVCAWEKIARECRDRNGYNLHITGASSHFFSCIYAYDAIDDDTGEILAQIIVKHTPSQVYVLTLDMPVEED